MKYIYEPKGAAAEYSPLALNLYQGCTGRCWYCYVPKVLRRTRTDFHTDALLRRTDPDGFLEDIRKEAWKLRVECDTRRIHMCFTCDPYPENSSFTRRVLEVLKDQGRPVSILTKQGTRARRDFDLLEDMDSMFGVSLSISDETKLAAWEPGTSTIQERYDALEEATTRGITTWASVEPVLDPAMAIETIRYLGNVVDEFRIGKLNHSAAAKQVDWAAFVRGVKPVLRQWQSQGAGRTWMLKKGLVEFLEAVPHTRKDDAEKD